LSIPGKNHYEGFDPDAVQLPRGVARRLAGQFGLEEEDSLDIEQILMSAVWRSLPHYDPTRGTKKVFLTRVIRNQARKIIEGQKAGCRDYCLCAGSLQDPVGVDEDGVQVELGETFKVVDYLRQTSGRIDPEEQAALAIDMDQAIQALPPILQAIGILLRQGLNDAEVARRLGISRTTFYKRRKEIQQRFEQAGIDDYLK
jgi:RNA polymerase sigma factor (sigma-70 family)